MSPAMTSEEMKARIEAGIEGAEAHVRTDGHHFEAVVVADAFEGLPRLKQHRLVFGVLREELREEVHALQLRTFTRSEWAEVQELL
jgi:acid stress-induced BolA-like protein IbaG/YrbA